MDKQRRCLYVCTAVVVAVTPNLFLANNSARSSQREEWGPGCPSPCIDTAVVVATLYIPAGVSTDVATVCFVFTVVLSFEHAIGADAWTTQHHTAPAALLLHRKNSPHQLRVLLSSEKTWVQGGRAGVLVCCIKNTKKYYLLLRYGCHTALLVVLIVHQR